MKTGQRGQIRLRARAARLFRGAMKFVSWNVNGIRAATKKGAMDFFEGCGADFVCLQEIKANAEVVRGFAWGSGATVLVNEARKPGYSGTAIIAREAPLSVFNGLGIEEHDGEGRVITAEYDGFYLVNVYTPNSQDGLRRLEYRQRWDRDFRAYLKHLEQTKPVIACGDLNVAHTEDDLANPKSNRMNAGFTDQERAGFSELLASGFVDTFRVFTQGKGHYSWWSYRAGARSRNVGWRIDYFIVSEVLRPKLASAGILCAIEGSDHCPVTLEL